MNTIITIGRQYGSGGKEIAGILSKELDIPFYDKDLITRAAKDSGFCEEMIQFHDERPTNSFLYNLVMDTYSFGYNSATMMDMPISQRVFLAQFDAIKKIANEGPCVIVGRCADYALADYKNAVHIFIHADEASKIERLMKKYDLTEQKARDAMIKKDRQRQSYYNYYSTKKWGRADSYDLTLNSAKLGIEGTVKLIKDYVLKFEEK